MIDQAIQERWIACRDADAFAELVARHAGMVYGTCLRILGNKADAEDLAQECFLELARRTKVITPSLGGWLHRVAVCSALNAIRGERRRKRREKEYAALTSAAVEPAWDDVKPYVDEAINALPAKLREAVILRFLEGRTHLSIGEELNLSPSAVQYRVDQGVRRIRQFLKRRGISAPGVNWAALALADAVLSPPRTLVASLCERAIAGHTGITATTVKLILTGGAIVPKKIVIAAVIVILLTAPFLAAPAKMWILKQIEESPTQATHVESGRSPSEDGNTALPSVTQPAPEETESQVATLASLVPQPVDAPPEAPASVEGLVQDEDAWPVADAHVWVEVMDEDKPQKFEATSDADGHYEVKAITQFGNAKVYAEAENHVMKMDVIAVNPNDSLNVDLTLEKTAYAVKGIVVTQQGNPVAEAEVRLSFFVSNESSSWCGGSNLFTLTREDGTFELNLPQYKDCSFVVLKEGFAEEQFKAPVGSEDIRVVLRSTGVISGRVLYSDQKPASGLRVKLLENTARKSVDMTQADGTYRVENVPPGVCSIGVFPPEEEKSRNNTPLASRCNIEVQESDETAGIDFNLCENPKVKIHGHVRDRATDLPVTDVSVFVRPEGSMASSHENVDEDGSYCVELNLNERSNVTISALYGFMPVGIGAEIRRADGEESMVLALSPGDDRELDLLADAPMSVPVRVTDEDGAPVPDIMVGMGIVMEDGQWEYMGGSLFRPDEQGRYLFKGVPARIPELPINGYFVWAQQANAANGKMTRATPNPLVQYGPISGTPGETLDEVVLRVEAKGGIEGILVDASGAPLGEASFILSAPGEDNQVVHDMTKADGGFVVVHALKPGLYPELILDIQREDSTQRVILNDIEIAVNNIVDLGTIEVPVSSE